MTAVGGKRKHSGVRTVTKAARASAAVNTNASMKARTVSLYTWHKEADVGKRKRLAGLVRVCISLSSLCYSEKICKNCAKRLWRCTPGAWARQELSAGGWLELGVEASLGNITISGRNTGTKGENQVRALYASTWRRDLQSRGIEVMHQVKGSHMRRLEKRFKTEHFSCRGAESGLQHPHWVAYTLLTPLASEGNGTLMYILTHRQINII